ncbi:MAG: hypothetical protein KJO40_18235 [Deltaproteobacteria bacterium]|nr:hypothetical protein [Deltaproteobacteria bacterium]
MFDKARREIDELEQRCQRALALAAPWEMKTIQDHIAETQAELVERIEVADEWLVKRLAPLELSLAKRVRAAQRAR